MCGGERKRRERGVGEGERGGRERERGREQGCVSVVMTACWCDG